jgi:nucleoside-diphosphate-sugar epimerase
MGQPLHYRSLPRRFRRPTLLVVGCGDVGTRLARQVLARHGQDRMRVIGVVRSAESAKTLRAAGVPALVIDLQHRRALERLRGLAHWMVDLAPPPNSGPGDPNSTRLIAALARAPARAHVSHKPAYGGIRAGLAGSVAGRWVYVSTTGVYGDTRGAQFDETRPVAPASARAIRRVEAERSFRGAARRGLARVAIARAPGIYAEDRLPIERLRKGLPALIPEHDVYTNHIHADDLANICWTALFRGRPGRVVHAVDDSDLKMGDYFDQVADTLGLPRAPRVTRDALPALVSPMMLSFMSESRRLLNRRLHRELRVRLRYPDVAATLASALAQGHATGDAQA